MQEILIKRQQYDRHRLTTTRVERHILHYEAQLYMGWTDWTMKHGALKHYHLTHFPYQNKKGS